MSMARTVNIGNQDFKDLRENNDFYIDKTYFIKEWWENRDTVTLITRPRRFGKTLAMSMTENFFSVNNKGRSDLFEGLLVWEEEKYRELQGTYPVISLSFSGIGARNFLTTRESICKLLKELYARFKFVLNSDLLEQEDIDSFKRITEDMNDSDAGFSIYLLCRCLYKYYGKKAIVLLDEYDVPMQEAYLNGYWDEMVGFMRGFFNLTFKANPWLERGLMTGVTRMSKESIFSDLNNLEVVTTTSEKYRTSFGFTESEVFDALKEFGLQAERQKVKEWYDGFCFGDCSSIYNPWTITNFLDEKKYAAYWANTSSNALVNKLVREGNPAIKMAMEDLLRGEEYRVSFDEEIVFRQLGSRQDAIWSLLLAGGYVKAVSSSLNARNRREYALAITNLEIKSVFEDMFSAWFTDVSADTAYNDFIKALLSNNLKEMNIYMNKVAVNTFSCFDSGKKPSEAAEPERFYHGFVLGLMVDLKGRYDITSNRESGYGRYDVMLEPLDKKDDGVILEFKVMEPDEEDRLQDTADNAIRQILEKKYAASLEPKVASGAHIRVYGFAFRGKETLISGGYLSDCENRLLTAESGHGSRN